jgi:hypothetical protein
MDLVFTCPSCRQQLEADASLAGTPIQCPSCNGTLTIPSADPQNIKVVNPIAASAAAREEKHFSVPVHDGPTEVLIAKPKPKEDVHVGVERCLRVKTIRRVDCVEVGHDRFDEIVTNFLKQLDANDIVGINTVTYTHIDIGSQKILTDFGVMIVYHG